MSHRLRACQQRFPSPSVTRVAQQSDQAFSQLGKSSPKSPKSLCSRRCFLPDGGASSACQREGKCVPEAAGDTICRMRKLTSPQQGNKEETSKNLPPPCLPSSPGTKESNPGGSMGLILLQPLLKFFGPIPQIRTI